PGQREHVRDERVLREGREIEPLALLRERVLLRHERDPVPMEDRQHRELREEVAAAARDREIDLVRADQLRDLLRRALVELEIHLRIALTKAADRLRQHVARLGMRRRDRQRALLLRSEVAREARDILDLTQDLAGASDDLASGGRHGGQALALARVALQTDLRSEAPQPL